MTLSLVRDRVLSCGLNGRVGAGATLAEHLPLPEATSGFGGVALALFTQLAPGH